jgi:cobalt-precorrin 5A hydrolase
LPRSTLDAIATSVAKRDEVGIAAVASALNVRLILVPQRELEAVDSRVVTRSQRVAALTGVPSVAEAAALAASGADARLLAPRVVVGAAACALAHVPEKWRPVFRQEHAPMQNKPRAGETS